MTDELVLISVGLCFVVLWPGVMGDCADSKDDWCVSCGIVSESVDAVRDWVGRRILVRGMKTIAQRVVKSFCRLLLKSNYNDFGEVY